MPLDLTPDQINQMQTLGIHISPKPLDPNTTLVPQTISKNSKPNRVIPLLSISGLTILSFGGILIFKNKEPYRQIPISAPTPIHNTETNVVPTQVPKSIQHYLLTSQQFFTSALQLQNCTGNPGGCPSSAPTQTAELINQSILTASDAIKEFPSDYRGYEQRGRIYQSLVDSQPQLLTAAISDLSYATKLNPSSAEITRSLASLFARQGDAKNTLTYLTQTVSLEPTKAQNFYDLAKLQQQTGQLPQALDTYNRLLTIIADPTQKLEVESQKSALEKLVAQNKSPSSSPAPLATPKPFNGEGGESPLLQADNGNGLIIAAPETSKDITVSNLADSNSLSGSSTLPANTAQTIINNQNLTDSAQVYLTITKGGKNQTLQVISRSTSSFTVGLDSPISEPIEFKWWIVK